MALRRAFLCIGRGVLYASKIVVVAKILARGANIPVLKRSLFPGAVIRFLIGKFHFILLKANNPIVIKLTKYT